MPAQKYFFDDIKDRAIRDAYTSQDINRRGGTVNNLARRLGIPRSILLRRARKLGLNPRVAKYGVAWTAEEDELLEQHAWKTPETISKIFRRAGFERSANAIECRRTRELGMGRREAISDAGIYKLSEAAALLGCNHTFLSGLIAEKKLLAKREGSREDGRASQWLIAEKDLRRVVIDYTAHLNFARIDKYWLVDLLTGTSRMKHAGDL